MFLNVLSLSVCLQFLNVLSLSDSLSMMDVNQRYRRYSPGVPLHGNIKKWWHYAYKAVVEEYIRPFNWNRIKKHRLVQFVRYNGISL